MRFRSVAMGALVGLVPLGLPAAAGEATICTFAYDPEVAPGLTTEPSTGVVSSHGETGTASCDGPVNGQLPTGSGTFGFEGSYDGVTCLSGGSGKGSAPVTRLHGTGSFTLAAR